MKTKILYTSCSCNNERAPKTKASISMDTRYYFYYMARLLCYIRKRDCKARGNESRNRYTGFKSIFCNKIQQVVLALQSTD